MQKVLVPNNPYYLLYFPIHHEQTSTVLLPIITYLCSKKKKWSNTRCGCECREQRRTCIGGNRHWDEDKCACVCQNAAYDSCNGGMSFRHNYRLRETFTYLNNLALSPHRLLLLISCYVSLTTTFKHFRKRHYFVVTARNLILDFCSAISLLQIQSFPYIRPA